MPYSERYFMKSLLRKKIRIIIMGYHNDALKVAAMLIARKFKHEVVAIILPANRPYTKFKPLIELAKSNNIPYFIPRLLNNEKTLKKIKDLNPDVIFSVSYTKMIPRQIYQFPRYGCINFHESLLPKHRGSHPLNWVILNGEKETGVTAHYVTDKLDAGDIIMQGKVKIKLDDNIVSLEEKTSDLTVKIADKIISKIEQGKSLQRYPQDESLATVSCPRHPEDGKIFWNWKREKIYNYVRGLTYPWPGAFTIQGKCKITLWKTKPVTAKKCIRNSAADTPGRILSVDNRRVLVAAQDGLMEILSATRRSNSSEKNTDLARLFVEGALLT